MILGDSPAAALDIAEHYRQAAFELLLARPSTNSAASPQVARDGDERDRLARLEPEALREWVANTVQRSFAGVLVGSVGEVAEQILAFHRAGIEIVQLEATTENAEDIRLRRQLIEAPEARRMSGVAREAMEDVAPAPGVGEFGVASCGCCWPR